MKTNRSSEQVQKEIQRCKDVLENTTKLEIPRDEFEAKLHKTEDDFENLVTNIKYLKECCEFLEDMKKARQSGFVTIRGSMCRKITNKFTDRLRGRKFDGQLKFDHEQKSLTMNVDPSGSNFKRETKSLSGGEKSFSTVSLILSLWEAIHPPFRMLDEFDVFMDMMNRNKSVEMMLDYARNKRQFQYLFLTPLDTNNIKGADDVKVQRIMKNVG